MTYLFYNHFTLLLSLFRVCNNYYCFFVVYVNVCVVCAAAAWAAWARWRAWAWRAPLPRTTAAARACHSTCSRTRLRTWCTRTPRIPRTTRTRTSTRSTCGTPTDARPPLRLRSPCTGPGSDRCRWDGDMDSMEKCNRNDAGMDVSIEMQ